MKKLTLTALGIVALAALPVSAANWSDTYLGYQYSNQFRDPGVSGNEVKSRTELSGVYGWDYGTNFFDVNMLWASHKDPANTPSNYGAEMQKVPGDTEVYCVYRSNFDLGKIFKTNMGFGPVREVDLTVGFDFDSTDNYFASNKKFVVIGPQFGINITKGFWNVGVGWCKELQRLHRAGSGLQGHRRDLDRLGKDLGHRHSHGLQGLGQLHRLQGQPDPRRQSWFCSLFSWC